MARLKPQDISDPFPNYPLAELHAHLGTSIDPAILWQIAHTMGIKLPKEEFHDFCNFVTLSPDRPMALNQYFKTVYHPILDRLSSGTTAVEEATYHTMSGAYRASGIVRMELRTNPMKHNFNAEVDLDHLILAMLHGMERALLEHRQLSAGIIFCIAREFDLKRNSSIVEKAIKYRRRGVVGLDVAGPHNPAFHLKDYADLFAYARRKGMRVTIHSGEVRSANDMWDALEYIKPDRIGHGILAAYDKPLMRELVKRGVVLEVCPMSNLATKAVANLEEIRFILRTFIENGVLFCINTDWPEVIEGCRSRAQYRLLRDNGILSEDELAACTRTAMAASFTPRQSGIAAYL